jgi:uncharacterized surface protein with fasciclin (FAS1) repeats
MLWVVLLIPNFPRFVNFNPTRDAPELSGLLQTLGSRIQTKNERRSMKQNYDVIETAKKSGGFQAFTGVIVEAGLEEALKEMGPYTVFAPTDQAFAKIPRNKLDDLLKPENKERLLLLMSNHIVPGKLAASELKTLDKTKTVQGEVLKIESRDGLWINEAKVVSPDLEASNGVLHGIDTVLMPTLSQGIVTEGEGHC